MGGEWVRIETKKFSFWEDGRISLVLEVGRGLFQGLEVILSTPGGDEHINKQVARVLSELNPFQHSYTQVDQQQRFSPS